VADFCCHVVGEDIELVNAVYLLTMLISLVFTIFVETLVLLVGLSPRHPVSRRLAAGVWLNVCSYPILWLVLPYLLSPAQNRTLYLAVGEPLVTLMECALFYLAFQRGRGLNHREFFRDWIAIILANLASFGLGELFYTLS
jgi:hypothetical protein